MALLQRRRSRSAVSPKLMITPMMDMFTIILIFLLFSFSENVEKIKLDADLELPRSTATGAQSESIQIVLSKTNLKLDGEVVATLADGKIQGMDPAGLENSVLYQRLKIQFAADRQKESETAEETKDRQRHVMLLCDRTHAFDTINAVIKTAGLAGYPNFQFAVLEE